VDRRQDFILRASCSGSESASHGRLGALKSTQIFLLLSDVSISGLQLRPKATKKGSFLYDLLMARAVLEVTNELTNRRPRERTREKHIPRSFIGWAGEKSSRLVTNRVNLDKIPDEAVI